MSTSLSKGWPAISDDVVLDTVLWCLIRHLWNSEMGKVLEISIVKILRHREIVEVECLKVREVSRNVAAGCFRVAQPAVLEVSE